ncbi:MAG: hypothetical protein JO322_15440 [Candidatus Eremiobacteraeota bacterium]|nr:hypothetical protein [Candidatus Eremiobacteraeota bacterium]
MSDRDIQKERERKDAEMHRQEERGGDVNDRLRGYDKAEADSFPASDPPAAAAPKKPSEKT